MKQPEYTDMQRVILASPINGAPYHGDLLPETPWQWPADTWMQRRITEMRKLEVRGSEFEVETSNPELRTSN